MVTLTTVAADEKEREMLCLLLEYIYGWLFTIDAGLVAESRREAVANYQRECYNALYEHFDGNLRRQVETNRAEIEALQAVNDAILREKGRFCRWPHSRHIDAHHGKYRPYRAPRRVGRRQPRLRNRLFPGLCHAGRYNPRPRRGYYPAARRPRRLHPPQSYREGNSPAAGSSNQPYGLKRHFFWFYIEVKAPASSRRRGFLVGLFMSIIGILCYCKDRYYFAFSKTDVIKSINFPSVLLPPPPFPLKKEYRREHWRTSEAGPGGVRGGPGICTHIRFTHNSLYSNILRQTHEIYLLF